MTINIVYLIFILGHHGLVALVPLLQLVEPLHLLEVHETELAALLKLVDLVRETGKPIDKYTLKMPYAIKFMHI